MTPPDLLRDVGEALYGSRWQSDLARDLTVTDRTVRRWAAGEHPIPAGVWEDIRKLIVERTLLLPHVAKSLPKPTSTHVDIRSTPLHPSLSNVYPYGPFKNKR